MKIEIEIEYYAYDTLQKIASQLGCTVEQFITTSLTAMARVMAPSGDPDPNYIIGMNAKFRVGLSAVENIQMDSTITSLINESSKGDIQ